MNAQLPLARVSALVETLLDGTVPLDGPPQLRSRTTGRSGAQTFEVVVGPRRFMLKLDAPERTQKRWRAMLGIQRAAAERGVTPPVVAWNAPARAVLSELVPEVSLFDALFDPKRIDTALGSLVDSVASLHAIDPSSFPRDISPLERSRSVLEHAPFTVPAFAAEAWEDFMRRSPTETADTLCHLDLNPSNLVYDGRKVWLVDWDTAAMGERWVDVATLVNMLLLTPERTRWMLQRYAASAGERVPSAGAFGQARRLVYIGYGCAFLALVDEAPSSVDTSGASLASCYRALQEGRLDMNTNAGRWQLAAAYFAGYWEVV